MGNIRHRGNCKELLTKLLKLAELNESYTARHPSKKWAKARQAGCPGVVRCHRPGEPRRGPETASEH